MGEFFDDFDGEPESKDFSECTKAEVIQRHLRMFREMLSPDDEDSERLDVALPMIYFAIGSWDGDDWIPSIEGGHGILLEIDESDVEDPKVLLGEFTVFEEDVLDHDISHEISRVPFAAIPIETLGGILGGSFPV